MHSPSIGPIRSWPLAAFLALVVLPVILLFSFVQPRATQVDSTASAVASLTEQPTEGSQPSASFPTQYRYIKHEGLYRVTTVGPSGTSSAFVPKAREMWIAPDGSGRIRESTGEPIFLSERDRLVWQAGRMPLLLQGINQDFGPGRLTYEDFSRYPTDPAALANAVRDIAARADPRLHAEMFVVVGDLLRQPGVPPPLAQALYQVAAEIPGVDSIGNVVDRAGRPGIALAMTSDYTGWTVRSTLVFDPSATTLLEEEKTLLKPVPLLDAVPPVVVGYTTYLASSAIAELPDPLLPVAPANPPSPQGSIVRPE